MFVFFFFLPPNLCFNLEKYYKKVKQDKGHYINFLDDIFLFDNVILDSISE